MNFSQTRMRRRVGLMGACVLALGGIAAATVGGARAAEAATCAVDTPCVITGSADLTAGVLNGSFPGSLTWSRTLSGANQNVADIAAGHQGFTVDDATTTGRLARQRVRHDLYLHRHQHAHPLCDYRDASGHGNVLRQREHYRPDGHHSPKPELHRDRRLYGAGTAAGQQPNFPVAVTTAAATPTAVTIYNAVATTGVGSVDIGQTGGNLTATNPVGWWIHVPGTTKPGSYTSTIDLTVISGPM